MRDPFIIAEIGINHNGSLEIAKQLIDMAKETGCDAVKFQKRDIPTVYPEEVLNTPRKSPWGETTREQKYGIELSEDDYDAINSHCMELDIPWFASAWDVKSQEFLSQYPLKYNKIASPMLTHKGFIEVVAAEGKHTFISTGMSNYEDIMYAVDKFDQYGTKFTLLHCVSLYPCPDHLCNLSMVTELKRKFNCEVGYSGHELGILPSVLAVAMGATVIERHITLDRSMYGSDQSASLEREGLSRLVRDCRSVGEMMGDGEKKMLPEEEQVAHKLRYFHETN
jgi:N-acetylneuraminate synthase